MKTTKETITEPVLIVDSHHGTYSPKVFLETINGDLKKQISPLNRIELRNPEGEFYWEAWEEVLNTTFRHRNQKLYVIQTDGDVWIVPANYLRTKAGKEFIEQY